MSFSHRPAPLLGALIYGALAGFLVRRGEATVTAEQPAPSRPVAAAIERPGTFEILGRVWTSIGRDHVSILAAGVAFYGLLSIFPGMSAAVSLYGLVADRADLEHQLQSLAGVLPAEALKLLSDQAHALITAEPAKLGVGLILSLTFAIWSANSGTSALMQALTIAYEEEDNRGTLHFYGLAIALTLGLIVLMLVALGLIAVVPAVLATLPVPDSWDATLSLVRWPFLAVLFLIGLALLYRLAPSRARARWEWFMPGTIAASVLWLAGSAGFSIYVARFGSYDKTYGSLGAVVVLLMWFYVTAYIILVGAELNAEFGKARRQAVPGAGSEMPPQRSSQ